MSESLLSNHDDKIRHVLIRIYTKQLLPLKLGNVLVALLLMYVLWTHADRWLLVGWFALQLFFMAIELYVAYAFKRHTLKFSHTTWVVILSVPGVLVGMGWGAIAPLFMDVSDPLNVTIITILLLGILSGSLYSLSLLPPLFHLFAAMILLQYVFTLYPAPDLMAIVASALTLALFSAWLSYQMFRITYDLLLSRYKIKAYARELKQAKHAAEQASTAKTRFLASACHDIRQPLQAMALYADILTAGIKKPGNIKSLDRLKQSHASMSRIMESLLDISKLDADIIEPDIGVVALQPMINRLVNSFHPMAVKKGICLRSRVAELHVGSDPVLLERIVVNLISNALRYTHAGGMLVACRRRDHVIMLEVWDTGKGIPVAQMENVFLEFYQLDNPERDQHKGLGLGLAIVQRLTQLLPNHSIEICSREGQGSRFRLTLPVAESEMVIERVEHNLEQMDQVDGMQVLVIEDNLAVRQAMVDMMQTWECRVNSVGSIAQAVAQLEDGWLPDAVVADYRLPDGETGVQAIQAIREQLQQHIPALIVSGESLPETLHDIQSAEDIFLLHKPVLPARLKMFLRRCNGNRLVWNAASPDKQP